MFKTINGYTKQTIIDRINAEFKGKSVNTNGLYCAYRFGMRKCAVGVFIPDNEYSDAMEERGAESLLEVFPKLRKFMPLEVLALLSLQEVHDKLDTKLDVSGQRQVLIEWVSANVE